MPDQTIKTDQTIETTHYRIIMLDIIGFSQKPMIEKIEYGERFHALLGAVLKQVTEDDRIIVETGDGAAIALSGAPEKALLVARALRDGLIRDNRSHSLPLNVRIAINSGPAEVVKGINNQPNIVGKGIDLAQHVMSLGKPDQILVSGAYLETILNLSDGFTDIFAYEAIKTGKHKHLGEVYLIHIAESASDQTVETSVNPVAEEVKPSQQQHAAPVVVVAAAKMNKHAIITTASFIAAIATIVLALTLRNQPSTPATLAASQPAKVAPGLPVAATPTTTAAKTSPQKSATANKPVRTSASVSLAVSPWGELYVDGIKKGITPPLSRITLDTGKHAIELRNPAAEVYRTEIDLQAGDQIKIRHKFE